MKTIVFGGGCFWCTEAIFKMLRGVVAVAPGYAGGKADNPSYADVVSGGTGHAEVVKIEYDQEKISLEELLTVFFGTHDPTTPNRQGADVGEQYRSAIFYTDASQKAAIEKFLKEINDSSYEGDTVTTEIRAFEKFYPAEDYHRNYYAKNPKAPYCQIVINPKLKKVKERFAELLNEN